MSLENGNRCSEVYALFLFPSQSNTGPQFFCASRWRIDQQDEGAKARLFRRSIPSAEVRATCCWRRISGNELWAGCLRNEGLGGDERFSWRRGSTLREAFHSPSRIGDHL